MIHHKENQRKTEAFNSLRQTAKELSLIISIGLPAVGVIWWVSTLYNKVQYLTEESQRNRVYRERVIRLEERVRDLEEDIQSCLSHTKVLIT